jgi:GNAT superfamily N-acetyltransferase
MNDIQVLIRPVAAADRDPWLTLWAGYLDFYRESLPTATTDNTFERLCENRVHPSTWSTTCYCYLEDLFVSRSARGTGAAKMLIEAVSTEAQARGASHVYWHTQEYNGAARSLYDQVARLTSFRVYER